jgi:hypothetical protein
MLEDNDNLRELNLLIPKDKTDIILFNMKRYFLIKVFYKKQTREEIKRNISILEEIKAFLFRKYKESEKEEERVSDDILKKGIEACVAFNDGHFEVGYTYDFSSSKEITEQFFLYNLINTYSTISKCVKLNLSGYWGRKLLQYVDGEDMLLNMLKKKNNYDFSAVLDSCDEVSPLNLFFSDDYTSRLNNNFYTNLELNNESLKEDEIERIINLLISYYTDPAKVLPEPYVLEETQSAGFKKKTNKKTNKKSNVKTNKKVKKSNVKTNKKVKKSNVKINKKF